MSYRLIKQALGETNIERKCRWLFGICLFFLIFVSFWMYGKQTEELVYKQNRNKGHLLVDTILTQHHFDTWDEDTTLGEYSDLIAELNEQLRSQREDYKWEFLLPHASPDQVPQRSQKDWDVVRKFLAMKPEPEPTEDDYSFPFEEVRLPENNLYVYYQPVRAKQMCLIACHSSERGTQGIQHLAGITTVPGEARGVGDLMAVVKVEIPDSATRADLLWNRGILMATAIVTGFLAMIAAYVIVRYVIVKPLKHLRDVSDAISHGEIDLRANIHTGDEFEELAVAFNRMLHHMVEVQDELRDVNIDLDSKVDELAQVNMRLYEMNRLKSDFLATMSHELRTPLNSIIGFSDVLEAIPALDDKQRRYVQNIQKSGKMLLDMINDILDLAKIESGKMEIRPSDFRIELVVAAQCDMARPLTEKKNIDLETVLDPTLGEMRQDQAKVQQILNNLLSNAIKFTPEGGRIVVSANKTDEGFLLLTVADTGVGIADEDQQVVFEKFRQGNTVLPSGDAMTREYSGTGLGLSIIKELCILLGGEVELTSELGNGSTFSVRLPWTIEEPTRLESPLAKSIDELAQPSPVETIARHAAPAVPTEQTAASE